MLRSVVRELFASRKGCLHRSQRDLERTLRAGRRWYDLFDEIGVLRPNEQVKLLQVLQEGTCEMLGSAKPIESNFRVVASTSKDLHLEVEKRSLRQDLIYRLNVLPIYTPPLLESKEDTRIHANHFAKKYQPQAWKTGETNTGREEEALRLPLAGQYEETGAHCRTGSKPVGGAILMLPGLGADLR
jgi:DNA-binding NtrC family response regulator